MRTIRRTRSIAASRSSTWRPRPRRSNRRRHDPPAAPRAAGEFCFEAVVEGIEVMIDMKASIYGLALAALLAVALPRPGHAEEATTPPAAGRAAAPGRDPDAAAGQRGAAFDRA